MGWNVKTWSLELSAHNFHGMRNEGGDHSRRDSRKGWTETKFFSLFIHGVEKASKHASFVAVGKTAPKTAFGAFIGINFFEPVD